MKKMPSSLSENTEHLPLISIVTVVFNAQENLERTILSVINQSYAHIEYIIIDGGSNDGTLEIIKHYGDKIDYWVSEADQGIYDAMNKGIRAANGVWINFMNAGDIFYDTHVLANLFNDARRFDTTDMIYSDVLLDGERRLECDIVKNLVIHQSLFYRKTLHEEFGPYLVYEKLLISDYLFFMLCKHKRWYKSEEIIAVYDTSGVSVQNSKLHMTQAIATNVLFNNTGRVKAGFMLLLYPLYHRLKRVIKEIFLHS